jgi:hypothetical protein
MAKIILGNGNNLSVSDDGSIGDTIIVGNGANDTVWPAPGLVDSILS